LDPGSDEILGVGVVSGGFSVMEWEPVSVSSAIDTLGRPLRDLRISVTDRCNFRCPYCMPREVFGADYPFLHDPQLMSVDELVRIARAFVALGVTKIRLTGGEPLLRSDLVEIVRRLKAENGAPEVALTTNGWLLQRHAEALRDAGLDRLNVSVDSLEAATAGRMNGRGFDSRRVLEAIDHAVDLGLPVKINMAVQQGQNDHEIEAMAAYFRERELALRFIEFMDVGTTNHWRAEQVLPAAEIVARIQARWPIEPLGPAYRGEVAARYRYVDGKGEIGIIASITEPFCRDCHRARLSADGKLHTCLFSGVGWDVLGRLRSGADQDALVAMIAGVWGKRTDRYSDERAERGTDPNAPGKPEMSYLGG
jgi:cyclic pyranopterin phosphate synthase